jgi:hypothetical protein
MSLLIEEFLNKYHLSVTGIQAELEKYPPCADYIKILPAFSNKYQKLLLDKHQKQLQQTISWLISEHVASLDAYSFDLSSKFKFWGNLNLINTHIHIALQALKFQVAQMGDALSRASFAAFKLYEILSPLAAKIYLKTNTQLAHPAVYIKLDKQWWIFDPNVNPDLIFDTKDYRQQVINHLPKTKLDVQQLNIQIKPELWLLFQLKLPKFNELIKTKLQEHFVNPEHSEDLVDESIHMLQKQMF